MTELHRQAPNCVSTSLREDLDILAPENNEVSVTCNDISGILQRISCCYRNYTEAFATLGLIRLLKGLTNHNQYFRANSLTCSKGLDFALHRQSKEGSLPDPQVSVSSCVGNTLLIEIYYIPVGPSWLTWLWEEEPEST